MRCTPNSLAAPTLLTSDITDGKRSLGLRIGPACEAGLSAGMRRECVPPQIRKKEKKEDGILFPVYAMSSLVGIMLSYAVLLMVYLCMTSTFDALLVLMSTEVDIRG